MGSRIAGDGNIRVMYGVPRSRSDLDLPRHPPVPLDECCSQYTENYFGLFYSSLL